jgi:hypothetical protein
MRINKWSQFISLNIIKDNLKKGFAITHSFTFVKVYISMILPLNMTSKALIFILKLVKTRGYDCNLNVILKLKNT